MRLDERTCGCHVPVVF
ncbi:MAG: hypothetical protein EOQ92_14965 [Mesorhizobium sp.]|nr:MAG: hypothetical protein EOQ92_14965 [Mesorhizobium sp.]RWK51581.1 MAG: hypothetical protein EOR47_07365 [Mesorhizobium sp.]RWK96307.1 MAG: hypothetical protein EOR53_10175 [Mesorhizobium sp.]TIP59852.1 MAG: hypothetical protein E5X56_08740 [Mesorhizobium sp.]TIQ22103.1 MAG: hypothetical protein E5X51_08550 [Mesorhizobium sp.]